MFRKVQQHGNEKSHQQKRFKMCTKNFAKVLNMHILNGKPYLLAAKSVLLKWTRFFSTILLK